MRARPFDELAAGYDATFTESAIGRTLRELVWARFERVFPAPCRLLELGCGTGEDALHLVRQGHQVVALDSSPRMIQVAQQKARSQGCWTRVEFHCTSMEQLGTVGADRLFDGVVSNFGAINCAADLPVLAREVAARLRPGAPLVWVVMGRYVPWEWIWYSIHGEWAKAWRRLSSTGVRWRGMQISYPAPRQLTRLLRPYFKIERVGPLGAVLPPTYAGLWLQRKPRLLSALSRLEQSAQRYSALASLSDHYVVEATRLTGGRV